MKHDYHVIRTDHGRRELRDGLKPVGDLTASPVVADALIDILFEHSALLEALNKIEVAASANSFEVQLAAGNLSGLVSEIFDLARAAQAEVTK